MAYGFNGNASASFTKGQYLRSATNLALNYGGEKIKTNFDVSRSKNNSIDNWLDEKAQNDAI